MVGLVEGLWWGSCWWGWFTSLLFHEWHATSSHKGIRGPFDEKIYEFALLSTDS